jgi:hypothetical protein
MLVTTITIILLVLGIGGGITVDVLDIIDAAEEAVEDNVRDRDRRAELVSLLKKMELETRQFEVDIRTHRQSILDLDLNPNATREEYLYVFRQLDSRWTASEEDLLNLLFEFREGFSPAEWAEVNGAIREELAN